MNEHNPWDQLENEPDAAYTRFLVYRNLGPTRSIEKAYLAFTASNRVKSRRASGQWLNDSSTYNWQERSSKWDASQLINAVPEAATTIFNLIAEVARTSLEQVQNGELRPTTWEQLHEMVVTLASFISPEVISQTIDNAGNAGSDSQSEHSSTPT